MTRTYLRIAIGVLGIWVMAASMPAARQANPAEALRDAMDTETVKGDLPGALEKYRVVADGPSPGHAARALLRMAGIYEKLGQPAEARRAHERIVRQFATEETAASVARTWLAAKATAGGVQVQAESLWTAQGAIGPPSRDGRYVAVSDWTTGSGNLAVRDLRTGDTRVLTQDGSQKTGWVGADPVISPDGTTIAYRWEGGPDESTRLIRADGTGMRVLYRQPYGDSVHGWSADGRWLVGSRRNYATDRSIQLVLISVADGSVTSLKTMGWQEPAIGGFSPDGRFVLYAWATSQDEGTRTNVYAIATDGSRETLIVSDTLANRAPSWSPDGRRVVFLRNRTGTPEVWSARVADGRPLGEPELLLPRIPGVLVEGPGVHSLGFASDGAYYYSVQNQRTDAYIATFDPATLTVTGTSPVTDRHPGANSQPELSPDGRRVAFVRSSPLLGRALVVRSLDSGEERSFPNLAGRIQWFPDGQSVMVLAADGRGMVRKVDIATGTAELLFQDRDLIWNQITLSPDGTAVFYTRTAVGLRSGPTDLKSLRLMKRVLATGDETELLRTDSRVFGYQGLSVSPDGALLAFSFVVDADQRTVVVMPAVGGEPREIHRADWLVVSHLGAMAWTRDGRHLIVTGRCGPGGSEALCALATDGGTLEFVGQNLQSITSRMISNDGRRIAFTGVSQAPELWVIRDLLPAPTASAR